MRIEEGKVSVKNLYLLEREIPEIMWWDQFDSCVVCATSAEEAAKIHPRMQENWNDHVGDRSRCKTPEEVEVTFIGKAADNVLLGEVICSSYNAS